MDIKVTQKFDDNYYQEFYSEWLTHRSKYRKWEFKVGLLYITLAVLIYFLKVDFKYFSIALIVFGCFLMYDFYATKRNWMKDRQASKMNHKSMTMIFDEHQVHSLSPFGEMKGKWELYIDVVETDKGLFLIPEKGISIYIQKVAFQNQADIKKIIAKIKSN